MDRLPELRPIDWLLLGIVEVLRSLYRQRWTLFVGIFIGIALCHWVPWLAGLDPRPRE